MIRVLAASLAVAVVLAAASVTSEGAESPKMANRGKAAKKGIPPQFKALTGGLQTSRKPRGLRQRQAPGTPHSHNADDLSNIKIYTPKASHRSKFRQLRRKSHDGFNR